MNVCGQENEGVCVCAWAGPSAIYFYSNLRIPEEAT